VPPEVVWSRQAEGDLGARMAAAVLRTLARDENVLCIGTDCLELEVKHLKDAVRALHQNPVVIAPAHDGGYVLLGLSQFDASIFQDMVWSTELVFKETIQRIERLGWRVTQLETLRDIDEPTDLAFLPFEFK
jgi:rSAM/selenodomain-associated transferase 1